MRDLAGALAKAYGTLVPSTRHRWLLLSLILIGAAIPLTELLVTKIFTSAVTDPDGASLRQIAPQLTLFVVLFLLTRVAHYAQRTYRVTFFEQAFRVHEEVAPPSAHAWQYALGLELVTILTALTQIVVLAGFFALLAPMFGLVNVLLVVVLAEALGRMYTRQAIEQRHFVDSGRAHQHVATHVRVRSRIAAAESGGLISSIGVLLLLVLLLAMSVNGFIGASSTIVLFLGLRMQNSTFATLSGAVMRFARARAHTS